MPTLRTERTILRSGASMLACIDEVGRGALSGPVTVGVVLVTATTRSAPAGIQDSKALRPEVRAALVPRIERWAHGHAVGHAEPAEIDEIGIIGAMARAARRAIGSLPHVPDAILLDGSHDYLTLRSRPMHEQGNLLEQLDPECAGHADPVDEMPVPAVTTLVKADQRCSGVAAASILAKVARDRLMAELAGRYPAYGWDVNKGYATQVHLDALARLGPSPLHRQSWRLPGLGQQEAYPQVPMPG